MEYVRSMSSETRNGQPMSSEDFQARRAGQKACHVNPVTPCHNHVTGFLPATNCYGATHSLSRFRPGLFYTFLGNGTRIDLASTPGRRYEGRADISLIL